jgi:hypothetical protein
VKTSAADLATLNSLTREMYDGAKAAQATNEQAGALIKKLDALTGADIIAFKARVDSLVNAPGGGAGATPAGGRGGRGGGGGRGGRGGGGTPAAPTFSSASAAMFAAAMAMQSAEVAPTSKEVAACSKARADGASLMAKWTRVTTVDLVALNTRRKAAGQPPITIDK